MVQFCLNKKIFKGESMSFLIDNYKNCVLNGFNTKGVLTRAEYWSFTLINIVIIFALVFLDVSFGFYSDQYGCGFLSGIFTLLVFIPSITSLMKRIQDIGYSGWWWLLTFIPMANIGLLVFTLMPSKMVNNKYR